MEDVKLAGTITLFTFLFALAAWGAKPPAHSSHCAPPVVTSAPPVLDSLQRDIEAMDRRVAAAIDALLVTQTHTDREAAKARLQELRREKLQLDKRIAEAKRRFGNRSGETVSH